ncbi:MAG: VanW family protein [Actinobacteria bacterium]|nr:VanW family protein [Actinomycetota bacterium]
MSTMHRPPSPETAVTTSDQDAIPPPSPPFARRRVIVAAAVLAVVVIAFVGALRLVHRGEVLPGVVVDGVEVGGLGRQDAHAALMQLVAARQSDPVTFTLEGREFAYVPGTEGYGADLAAAVDRAMAPGRDRNVLADSWTHVASLSGRRIEVSLVDRSNEERARAFVTDVAEQVDREPFVGRVTADPDTLVVTAEPPADGVRVKQEQALDQLLAAIRVAGPQSMPLPAEVLPVDIAPEQVDRVAAQARHALAEPLRLTAHGSTVAVLDPGDVAPLIAATVNESGAFVLHVPVDAVRSAFAPYLDRLNVAPRSATFEVIGGLVAFDDKDDATWEPKPADLRLVPSADGAEFDPERTARQLTELLTSGTRRAALDLVVVEPDLTTEQARGLGVTKLIGTFTTYHECCKNRVRNIQRMADLIRGKVLRPGETFSINAHVGERTRAKGFAADGTIVGGEYVNEVGGGVSQFATTAYNAAFFAGIDIVEHKAHSYFISRYPMGREATLYYPGVDLKLRNDSDNGILIHTSYTDRSITVSLFGDNGGRRVTAVHGQPTNWRDHRTVYRDNPSLRPGSSRRVQAGGRGFDVTVTRTIDRDGRSTEQRIFTRYEAPLEIVERNDRAAPPPAPAPEQPAGDDPPPAADASAPPPEQPQAPPPQ